MLVESLGQESPRQTPSWRMPDCYFKKYFGKPHVHRPKQTEAWTKSFLAEQLEISEEEIELRDERIYLSKEAYRKIWDIPLNDDSFLATGGAGRVFYEKLEMAYNDVISGSVEAGHHSMAGLVRQGFDQGVRLVAGPQAPEVMNALSQSGAFALAAGAGMGVTAGVGVWLIHLGLRQLRQAIARGDDEQLWEGGRSLFLGTESLAASAALGGTLGEGPLFALAGQSARTVARPFAVVHGVIDVCQGASHLVKGYRERDPLQMVEGGAEVGMGIGWLAVAYAPTPITVATSCACLAVKLGISLFRNS